MAPVHSSCSSTGVCTGPALPRATTVDRIHPGGMSDDPAQIRAAARVVNRLADTARAAARGLRQSDAVQWHSEGADRFRERLADRAREFGTCAQGLDDLRDRLYAHARAVERHEQAVVATVRAGAEGLEDLRDSGRDLLREALPGGHRMFDPPEGVARLVQ